MTDNLKRRFVDERGVCWGAEDADREGYLFKKSRWLQVDRKRFVILKRGMLFFSEDDQSPPYAAIHLADASKIEQGGEGDTLNAQQQSEVISIQHEGEVLLLRAGNAREAQEWKEALVQAREA